MSSAAKMSSASSVYFGPSSAMYPSVGSVSASENITVFSQELGWFYIEYTTSTKPKRGYVPMSTVQNYVSLQAILPYRDMSGYSDMPSGTVTVYYGPSSSSFQSVGSISANEGFTRFSETSNGYCYCEYSTSSGPKRGYVALSALRGICDGATGIVTSAAPTYYGADASLYASAGSLDAEEYVVILEAERPIGTPDKWYLVEYNTKSGRKRAYIRQDKVDFIGTLSNVPSLQNYVGLAIMSSAQQVRFGPSTTFASVGSVSLNELVFVLNSELLGYTHIEYNTSSGKKRGYALSSALSITDEYQHMSNARTKVYYGPSDTAYDTVGTLFEGDPIKLICEEKDRYFIEYSTPTTFKRGYVPKEVVSPIIMGMRSSDAAAARTIAAPSIRDLDCKLDYAPASGTDVFASPHGAKIGSLGSREAFFITDHIESGYTFIEYSAIGRKTKRGYISNASTAVAFSSPFVTDGVEELAVMTEADNNPFSGYGVKYDVPNNTSLQVYATPGTLKKAGSVSNGEVIIILAKTNPNEEPYKTYDIAMGTRDIKTDQFYFISYNTSKGTKTGYIIKKIGMINDDSLEYIQTSGSLRRISDIDGAQLYYNPTEQSGKSGSLIHAERVNVFPKNSYDRSEKLEDYSFVEYCSGWKGTPSRGYVLTSKLGPVETPELVRPNFAAMRNGNPLVHADFQGKLPAVMPTPPSFTPYATGSTPVGNHQLGYYHFGSTSMTRKSIICTYNTHGYEDGYAADGEALTYMASKLCEYLYCADAMGQFSQGNWSKYAIYVVPNVNPDGITHGYTHDGPGRCTVGAKTDTNRTMPWPVAENTDFGSPNNTRRSFTNVKPLMSYEAASIWNFFKSIKNSSGALLVIDTHGWLDSVMGESQEEPIRKLIGNAMGLPYGGESPNTGFLDQAVRKRLNGYGVMIELTGPGVYAKTAVEEKMRGYMTKFVAGLKNLIENHDDYVKTAPTVDLNTSSDCAEVEMVGTWLKYNGYYAGTISSAYSTLLSQAVKSFQASKGFTQTGNVDATTWTAMGFSISAGALVINDFYKAQRERADFLLDSQSGVPFSGINNAFIKVDDRNHLAFGSATYPQRIYTLSPNNAFVFKLTATMTGYKISPLNDSTKHLVWNPNSGNVEYSTDTSTAFNPNARWRIVRAEQLQGSVKYFISPASDLSKYLLPHNTGFAMTVGALKHEVQLTICTNQNSLIDLPSNTPIGVTYSATDNTYLLNYSIPSLSALTANVATCSDNRYKSLEELFGSGYGIGTAKELQRQAMTRVINLFKDNAQFDMENPSRRSAIFGTSYLPGTLKLFEDVTDYPAEYLDLFFLGYLGRASGFGAKHMAWFKAVESLAKEKKEQKVRSGVPYGTGANTLTVNLNEARSQIGFSNRSREDYITLFYNGNAGEALFAGADKLMSDHFVKAGVDGPYNDSDWQVFVQALNLNGYTL